MNKSKGFRAEGKLKGANVLFDLLSGLRSEERTKVVAGLHLFQMLFMHPCSFGMEERQVLKLRQRDL